MTDLEAAQLAQRIVSGWPQRSAITADEWATELRQLDSPTASTVLVRMRRERTAPPSIAEFLRTYRVARAAGRPMVDHVCESCDGAAWIETRSLVLGVESDERYYSQVIPCPACGAGRAARDVHARISATTPPFRWEARTDEPLSHRPLPPMPEPRLPVLRPGDPIVDVDAVLIE